MTYIVCAYDKRKNLVVTVQTNPIYMGPGKPNSFNVKFSHNEAYIKVKGIAESVFGTANVAPSGKSRMIVGRPESKVSTFLSQMALLARTLDTKLDS